jgi:hypothetical protein
MGRRRCLTWTIDWAGGVGVDVVLVQRQVEHRKATDNRSKNTSALAEKGQRVGEAVERKSKTEHLGCV